MTQLDPNSSRTRFRRRTWRDLPPTPPVGEVLPPIATQVATPPIPSQAPVEAQSGGSKPGRVIAYAAGAAAVIAGMVAAGLWFSQPESPSGATTPTIAASQGESGSGSPSEVAAAVGPAVVSIEVLGGLESGGGVGSGVIYDASGLILTAHHVVSYSDEVVVKTADGRSFNGRVVGRTPERDLAIVAIDDATDLVAATIAEPGTVEVGEPVVALGSPFGFQQSVTAGIISGLDRELPTSEGTLTGLIQTDAPINPGNSGGPLVDYEARVIGINTAIATMSGGSDGVGFAIPVEDYSSLMDEVEANGGVDGATVPAPQSSGSLDELVPGLDDLFPGLDDLLGPEGGAQGLEDLPGLREMLEQMFGTDQIPPELQQMLEELFGLPPSTQEGGDGA